LLVRRSEDGFVGVGRPDAVAALRLVGIRAWLSRQHARVRADADHLIAQPAVLELVEQRLCGGDEGSRLDRRLGLDRRHQLRRSEVCVDEPIDVTTELQPQLQVPLGNGRVLPDSPPDIITKLLVPKDGDAVQLQAHRRHYHHKGPAGQ